MHQTDLDAKSFLACNSYAQHVANYESRVDDLQAQLSHLQGQLMVGSVTAASSTDPPRAFQVAAERRQGGANQGAAVNQEDAANLDAEQLAHLLE